MLDVLYNEFTLQCERCDVRSIESEIAPQTQYLYILAISFFKQFKYISVLSFASVIDKNTSFNLICKNEKKNRLSPKSIHKS